MPSNTHTIIGGTKRFECRVIGHPRPEIRWFKDGREITHITRYNFDHTHDGVISMIMEDITHRDEGQYRCRAENTEGIASTSAYLQVRAHKEHPDEEIEEVHSMELEEHFVRKSKTDHSIFTDLPKEYKMESDASRRRTFEQIVDEEKENTKEVLNGTVSKEYHSTKSSSESSTTEQSYSKQMKSSRYEESMESTSSSSKKTTTIVSQESSSEAMMAMKVTVETERSSRSSDAEIQAVSSEADAEKSGKLGMSVEVSDGQTSSRSTKEEAQSLRASATTEQASSETTSTKSKGEEIVTKVTKVTTEQTSVETSRKSKEGEVTTSVSVEQTSSETSKKSGKLTSSVSTEEFSSDASKKVKAEGMKLDVSTELEASRAGRGLGPGEQNEEDSAAQDLTDASPASLCNDSGFMEASMLDSALLQSEGSLADSAQGSSVMTPESETRELDTRAQEADTKAKSRKKEISVEESRVEEVITSETSDITSLSQKSEKTTSKKIESSSVSATTVTTQESSMAEEVTDDATAETVTESKDKDKKAKAGKEADKTEMTSVSQGVSHVEETEEKITGGDITGLLDERPDPATVIEEAVAEAENEAEDEQRTRWVDQITSRTETLAIEGEGKKVEQLSQEEAAAVTQTLVEQTGLRRTSVEEAPGTSVDAENLLARQESVVGELSAEEEQLAALKTATTAKGKKDHTERLEVNEELSAKNVLGLQKAPSPDFGDVGSSVDDTTKVKTKVSTEESGAKTGADKQAALSLTAEASTGETKRADDDEEVLTIQAETSTEESRKAASKEEENELRMSAEVSTSEEGRDGGLSAPRLVAVPDDISVQLGHTIHLSSQVQGNPQPEVKWFKAGDSLRPGERVTLRSEHDVFTLEIREALESDAGTYTLTAHNAQGTIFSDVLVTVTGPVSVPTSAHGEEEIRLAATVSIPEFLAMPDNVVVNELGTLELVCTIKGSPTPTVVWSKDGKTLQSDNHMSVFESGGQYYLTIPRATVGDGGDYTCTASNTEGRVTRTVNATVQGGEAGVSDEGAAAMAPQNQPESSSDVSSDDSASTRYLKLVTSAAAFTLAAFGFKRMVECLKE